jgi:uncharacterized cofD-like protein
VVLIGPGSLFTSVLAACVVPGITQALAGTRATRIYVANLHPELPETEGYSLQDHVDALSRHGVAVDLVLADKRSSFARDPCTTQTRVLDLSDERGLVHNVQKLASAVRDEVPR